VSDVSESDARLAEAWMTLGPGDGDALPEEMRERIWLAVSGQLPPAERQALVDETIRNPAAAEAWRVAREMWLAARSAHEGSDAAGPPAAPAKRDGRWAARWLAAAAVLALGVGLGVWSLSRTPADEFRAAGEYRVESLVPAGSALPRQAFRLRWTPGPSGSRYTVRVSTEDLRILTTAADLSVPELAVDAAALAPLGPGATVLWQVDVALPEGDRTSSETFAVRLE
jgi:hypothetical protein